MNQARTSICLLGTGNAFNTDGRGSQCIWIEPAGGSPFLVDVGPTVLASMNSAGMDPALPDRVFITHLHGDHIAGWPFFLLHARFVARRTRPLEVIGPTGLEQHLQTLVETCYGELARDTLGFDLTYRELPVERSSGLSSGSTIRFDVMPLDHHATSIGYRFQFAGVSIAVSGDTRWCSELEQLGAGCDLMLLECTCLQKPDYAHMSLDELRQGVDRLGAGRIVLVHLSDDVAEALENLPIANVVAAEDGMRLEV